MRFVGVRPAAPRAGRGEATGHFVSRPLRPLPSEGREAACLP